MKKQFRITLFAGASTTADTLALMAAKSNGGENITINDLNAIFKLKKFENPATNSQAQFVIVNDHTVHLDDMVGGEFKTVLIIEEIEILNKAFVETKCGTYEYETSEEQPLKN